MKLVIEVVVAVVGVGVAVAVVAVAVAVAAVAATIVELIEIVGVVLKLTSIEEVAEWRKMVVFVIGQVVHVFVRDC